MEASKPSGPPQRPHRHDGPNHKEGGLLLAGSNLSGHEGEYFAAVALEAADHAATIETAAGMILLRIVGPAVTVGVTLTRAEARDMAYRTIEASQWLWERGEG
jgi:hypothetical protein